MWPSSFLLPILSLLLSSLPCSGFFRFPPNPVKFGRCLPSIKTTVACLRCNPDGVQTCPGNLRCCRYRQNPLRYCCTPSHFFKRDAVPNSSESRNVSSLAFLPSSPDRSQLESV